MIWIGRKPYLSYVYILTFIIYIVKYFFIKSFYFYDEYGGTPELEVLARHDPRDAMDRIQKKNSRY